MNEVPRLPAPIGGLWMAGGNMAENILSRCLTRGDAMQDMFDAIVSGIKQAYGFLAVVPYIPFLAVWAATYWIGKNKKRSTQWSMDVTTALLIGSVSALFNNVFGGGFGFYLILLLFVLAFGLLGNMQNRIKGKIDAKKLVKVIWRFGFVGLSCAYVILFAVSIGKKLWAG